MSSYLFPFKYFQQRIQRKMYSRVPPVSNSFVCSNLLNDNNPNDEVKQGHVWLLLGWEFNLRGPLVNVNQVDTAIHFCPPDVNPELFGEGLIAIPPNDIGSFQLGFGNQTTTAAGGIGKVIGGVDLGSTVPKWPLMLKEKWFIAAYFLSTTNNTFTPANGTIGTLKLLIMDLKVEELCKL